MGPLSTLKHIIHGSKQVNLKHTSENITFTKNGSSGSVCFDLSLSVIALPLIPTSYEQSRKL